MSLVRFHLATTLNRARPLWALVVFLTFHAALIWVLLTYVGWMALLTLIVTVPFVGGLSEVAVRRLVERLMSPSGRLWHDVAASDAYDATAFQRIPSNDEQDAVLFDSFLEAATRYGSARVRKTALQTLRARGHQSTIAIKKPS
ncbi:hypothetical protein LBMAG48_27190 [Phycisphaerae bacterium]|jgi:hypothetical protein|nr:hypothetical protein LBMAG48_27190 [Phycisphaerae bacterium]